MNQHDRTRNTAELNELFLQGNVTPEGIIYQRFAVEMIEYDEVTLFPAKHHTAKDIENAASHFDRDTDCSEIGIGKVSGSYPIRRKPPVWTPEQRLAGFKKIVEDHQHGKVENAHVDATTANYVLQVYDALNDVNKAKLMSKNAAVIVQIVYKLI